MTSVASPRVVNIEDLRLLARRRLPKVVFDYLEGGAEGEVTLRENRRAFDAVTFRPHHAVSVSGVDLRTAVLGSELAFPVLLAPVGYSRLLHPAGERAAAGAAGAAGVAYILSTMSGHKLEEVKAASSGPVWYQLYLIGGRDAAEAAIARARAAGYAALVVTIDTPVAGLRERDVRNGSKELLTRRIGPMLPYIPQFLARPHWLLQFFRDGGLMQFPNVMLAEGPMPYADVAAALEQSTVTWADLRWIREIWKGPIVIKGVHIGEDARRAVGEGADAVVVSNHGGRQLDGVHPTIRVLPEVLDAVGGRVEVLLDGGIRRGGDGVKALCLGARAVLVGRAYAYGLGAAGGPGVTRALDILRADIVRTMKLLGCRSLQELNRSLVDVPDAWMRRPPEGGSHEISAGARAARA